MVSGASMWLQMVIGWSWMLLGGFKVILGNSGWFWVLLGCRVILMMVPGLFVIVLKWSCTVLGWYWVV